jgi:hypothetical protein
MNIPLHIAKGFVREDGHGRRHAERYRENGYDDESLE